MPQACHRFWKCYKALTFCSLLARCRIPCACHAKPHLNLQKWSECAFNILKWKCGASRHNSVHFFDMSTSKRCPKLSVLYILTSKCASRHNGVQFFISHLARWLRSGRFSEATSRPSGATNHQKNTVNHDFSTFSRTCIFFLLTLSLL